MIESPLPTGGNANGLVVTRPIGEVRLTAANDCQDVKPVFAAPALASSRSLSPLVFSLPCYGARPIKRLASASRRDGRRRA